MKISFLLNNAFGIGGTVAAVFELAGGLAKVPGVQVEVISLFRRTETPLLRVPIDIKFGYLVDTRDAETQSALEYSDPSEYIPPEEEYFSQYSIITDDALKRYASRGDVDLFVATRPSLAIALAQFDIVNKLVVQMHHVSSNVAPDVHEKLRSYSSGVRGVQTLTNAEQRFWHGELDSSTHVSLIPNAVRLSPLEAANAYSRNVVAIGRLDPIKRFDLLIDVFHRLPSTLSEWSLTILGEGDERPKLEAQIRLHGGESSVRLAGRTPHVFEQFANASVMVSTSTYESFGLTLIEGMSSGLAVLSSDCEIGPRELIVDGENGLLFRTNDEEALLQSLIQLLSDANLRQTLGRRGVEFSKQFSAEAISEKFLSEFC